jgi:hypothetical protein
MPENVWEYQLKHLLARSLFGTVVEERAASTNNSFRLSGLALACVSMARSTGDVIGSAPKRADPVGVHATDVEGAAVEELEVPAGGSAAPDDTKLPVTRSSAANEVIKR